MEKEKTMRQATVKIAGVGWLRIEERGGKIAGSRFVEGYEGEEERSAEGVLGKAVKQVEEWAEGKRERFELPLEMKGTAMRKAVWEELMKTRRGERVTYGELARRAGYAGAARAVGSAMHANAFHLIVPCHRVVPARGGIGGFAVSTETKRKLLELESGCRRTEKAP